MFIITQCYEIEDNGLNRIKFLLFRFITSVNVQFGLGERKHSEKAIKKMADKKKKGLKSTSEKSHSGSKKPSMKTASDVISRLQWDESLPKEKFFVGYLDRFDGIIEKPFTALDWRDPAIVDNYTLALPKHRIQYFKYLNRKVWDKRTRTDIMFGSLGFPHSIYEFISMVDQDVLDFQDEDVDPVILPLNDEKICETTEDGNNEEEYDNSERSNFFIAVRIVEESTVSNLKRVSDYMKSRDEFIGQCCMTPEMLHLTLFILKLDNPSDICNAISAMKAVSEVALPQATIEMDCLDDFEHRVLFSRVEKSEELVQLRDLLAKELTSKNVNITDKYKFVPHVTIAKLSRPICKLRHSNFIDQYLYLKFEDDYFGKQVIDKLYLCEMGKDKREDGFYRCAFEVSLNNP